jgi:hypothetical protein
MYAAMSSLQEDVVDISAEAASVGESWTQKWLCRELARTTTVAMLTDVQAVKGRFHWGDSTAWRTPGGNVQVSVPVPINMLCCITYSEGCPPAHARDFCELCILLQEEHNKVLTGMDCGAALAAA